MIHYLLTRNLFHFSMGVLVVVALLNFFAQMIAVGYAFSVTGHTNWFGGLCQQFSQPIITLSNRWNFLLRDFAAFMMVVSGESAFVILVYLGLRKADDWWREKSTGA